MNHTTPLSPPPAEMMFGITRPARNAVLAKACAVLLTTFLTFGCSEAVGPDKVALRIPRPAARETDALNTVSLELSATPQIQFLAHYPFAEGVLAALSIQGYIHIKSDPQAACVHVPDDDVDYNGVNEWCGTNSHCVWYASLNFRGTSSPGMGCPAVYPGPYYSQVFEWQDTAVVGGDTAIAGVRSAKDSVFVVRGPASMQAPLCGSNPCATVTGSQTVTLSPLAADLDLRGFYSSQAGGLIYIPALTHSVGYYTVAFRDSATPRSAKGIAMPVQAISWAWNKTDPDAVPDSFWHSTDIAQCPTRTGTPPTSNTCNLDVKESGVLTSVARVNGIEHTDSVTIECATGDPALDNLTVRTDLMERLKASDNPDPMLRRERGGVIYQDTLDGHYFTMPDTAAVSTDCTISPRILTIPPNAIQIGQYHTHPSYAPDSAASCVDTHNHPFGHKVEVNPSLNGGGSNADWTATNQGFPEYIISLHGEVFRLNADSQNLTPAQKSANPNRWQWKSGLCAWRNRLQ